MSESKNNKTKVYGLTPMQGAAFLVGVTGTAALGGFGMMFAKARKLSPDEFHEGILSNGNRESGARLALRALGRATVYAVGGFSLFCFGVWKLMGVNNMDEFRTKMQSIMPRVTPENAKTEEIDWNKIFHGNSKENINTKSKDA